MGGVDTIYAFVDGAFRKVLEKAFGSTLGSDEPTQSDAENKFEPLPSAKEFYDIKITSTDAQYSLTAWNKKTGLPVLKVVSTKRKITTYSFNGAAYVSSDSIKPMPSPPPGGDDRIPTPIPNSPVHSVGVIYDDRDPPFLILEPPTGKGFSITAELIAEVGDVKYGVYTGYHDSDPLQGEVYVSVPGGGVGGQFYSTPEATGPAKMVSINGSVLTIVTLGGTYDKREPGTGDLLGTITAPGGAQYKFDLATRTFK